MKIGIRLAAAALLTLMEPIAGARADTVEQFLQSPPADLNNFLLGFYEGMITHSFVADDHSPRQHIKGCFPDGLSSSSLGNAFRAYISAHPEKQLLQVGNVFVEYMFFVCKP